MPLDTKVAMRSGIDVNPIIVGAYTDRSGGVCPMLAAHRHGGRTAFASFARAWDKYARAGNGARPATERELRTLVAMLDASIATDEARGVDTPLADAIADHRSSQARRARREEHQAPRDTGERDRTSELRGRRGWAWLRPVRRLDDYERVLGELERAEKDPARERQPV